MATAPEQPRPPAPWFQIALGCSIAAFVAYAAGALIQAQAPVPQLVLSERLSAPCPAPAEGQVTHIMVRVDNGELVASCTAARGRK